MHMPEGLHTKGQPTPAWPAHDPKLAAGPHEERASAPLTGLMAPDANLKRNDTSRGPRGALLRADALTA